MTFASGAFTYTSTNRWSIASLAPLEVVARGRVRRDRRDQREHAVLGEQPRDVRDALHVRVAILAREAEPLGQEAPDSTASSTSTEGVAEHYQGTLSE